MDCSSFSINVWVMVPSDKMDSWLSWFRSAISSISYWFITHQRHLAQSCVRKLLSRNIPGLIHGESHQECKDEHVLPVQSQMFLWLYGIVSLIDIYLAFTQVFFPVSFFLFLIFQIVWQTILWRVCISFFWDWLFQLLKLLWFCSADGFSVFRDAWSIVWNASK